LPVLWNLDSFAVKTSKMESSKNRTIKTTRNTWNGVDSWNFARICGLGFSIVGILVHLPEKFRVSVLRMKGQAFSSRNGFLGAKTGNREPARQPG
jgi:hypothetical protein